MSIDRVLVRFSLDSPTPLMKQIPTIGAFILALATVPFISGVVTEPVRFAVGIVLIVVASLMAIFVRWESHNQRWTVLIPCISLIAAGALRVGTGGSNSPYAALILLPFVWIASEEGRLNALYASLGVFLILVIPIILSQSTTNFGEIVHLVFTPLMYCTVALVINEIAHRVRQQLEAARKANSERDAMLEEMVQASTERTLNEARLRTANRLIRSIWNAVTEQSVIGTDLNGLIDVWNPGSEKMFGLTEAEVIKSEAHVVDFHLHSELDERLRAMDARITTVSSADEFSALIDAVRAGYADVRDWTYVRPDGKQVPVQVAATPRLDENGHRVGFIFVATDMTQAREFARLKDQFVGLISHELRTPLSSILGYLELMRDDEDAPLSEEQLGYLAVAERNAHRLLRLVGDLLFTAQVESGQFPLALQDLDINAVVTASIESATPAARTARVELTAELTDAPALVNGDPQRLGQAVDNLISNAIKFTPHEGSVTVSVSSVEDHVLIRVADTGMGIPAVELSQLSTRFFRASTATRNAVPGVGLGLTITKAIVTAHGGRLDIESEEGVGTAFTITLPRAGGAE